MLNPNELVLTFGSFTSVPIVVHIIVILRRLDQCKNIYWKFVKCVILRRLDQCKNIYWKFVKCVLEISWNLLEIC